MNRPSDINFFSQSMIQSDFIKILPTFLLRIIKIHHIFNILISLRINESLIIQNNHQQTQEMYSKDNINDQEGIENYSELVDNGFCQIDIKQSQQCSCRDNPFHLFMGNTFSHHKSISDNNKPSCRQKGINHECQLRSDKFNQKCSCNQALDGVEPWSEKNFEITEYHKKQCMQKKLKNVRKVSGIGISAKRSKQKQWNETDRNTITYNEKWQQKQKQCSHRICSSRKQGQNRNDVKFNTISTSTQEKIKWQIEMDVMMRRRKKVSNMLKIRHFGHLKINTEIGPGSKNGKSAKKQDLTTKASPTATQSNNNKIQQKPGIQQMKNKQKIRVQVQNLYSVLKSFTHRDQVKRRMSQTKNGRIKERSISEVYSPTSIFSHIPRKGTIHRKTSLNDEVQVKGLNFYKTGHLMSGEEDLKSRFSQILSNRESRLNKNRSNQMMYTSIQENKIHSNNEPLTKQNYSGHSIKNRLKLLKSRTKTERSSTQILKQGQQKVQQINCLTKLNNLRK